MTKIAGAGSGSINQRSGSIPKCHGSATLQKEQACLVYSTRISALIIYVIFAGETQEAEGGSGCEWVHVQVHTLQFCDQLLRIILVGFMSF